MTQIVCGECDSLEALLGQFARATELAALRILLGIGRQIDLAECEQAVQRDAGGLLAASLAGVAQGFRSRNRLAYLAHLEQAERVLAAMDRAEMDAREGAVSRFLAAAVGFPPGIPSDSRMGDADWRSAMRKIGENLIAEDGNPGELIGQVLEFVRENYMLDIGIGQIAAHIRRDAQLPELPLPPRERRHVREASHAASHGEGARAAFYSRHSGAGRGASGRLRERSAFQQALPETVRRPPLRGVPSGEKRP